MNVTLDGYLSGPNCELDWHFERWTEEMAESACEQLSQADTILLGRVTYSAMARYWPSTVANPSFPRVDIAFAEMINGYVKVVFSKTLKTTEWNNSRLVKGSMAAEIKKLKQQPGKDLILYGSSSLVYALTQLGLVDEYQVWVHPVALGRGKPLFKDLSSPLNMELFRTKTFRSGVLLLYFRVDGCGDKTTQLH